MKTIVIIYLGLSSRMFWWIANFVECSHSQQKIISSTAIFPEGSTVIKIEESKRVYDEFLSWFRVGLWLRPIMNQQKTCQYTGQIRCPYGLLFIHLHCLRQLLNNMSWRKVGVNHDETKRKTYKLTLFSKHYS